MQMRVWPKQRQSELHGVTDAHCVDIAHVEDFDVGVVHQALFAFVEAAEPIWRLSFGLTAGMCPLGVSVAVLKSA